VQFRAADPGDLAAQEAAATCRCQHAAELHHPRGPCRLCSCTGFVTNELPGELTARSVLRFGDLVIGFAQELAARR
jgi:hypothetical protein